MAGKIITSLHTHVIELDGGKSLTLRKMDNGTVDVTIEMSETECYGVEVSTSLFLNSMQQFLNVMADEPYQCPSCEGLGEVQLPGGEWTKCRLCDGTGAVGEANI